MKGDFTRRTFRASNHYRSVLVQQGRLTTDADHNEDEEIQEHLDRITTLDTIGRRGAPAGHAGLEIVCAAGDITAGGCLEGDLRITAGRYYVDGILCENEDPVPLGAQPDLPGVPLPTMEGRYIAYLDVWAEHVTALERPELREVALGGPDTATRARTIWQVRLEGQASNTCPPADRPWAPKNTGAPGRLRAQAKPSEDDPGPCVVPATARYRRLENQLYRVEIHTAGGSGDGPTFVWSRENGSVAARLLAISGDVLTIDAPGRDERLGFATENWVEVVDTDRTRRGEPGFLAQLDVAEGTKLTVRTWLGGVAPPTDADLSRTWVIRRWESAGELPVGTGWVDLEDGVQVEFDSGGTFRTGDYWLIPARSANLTGQPVNPDLAGNLDWPREDKQPAFRPPVGIEHHYAPVAVLELDGSGWRRLGDCRTVFPPLGGLVDVEYAGGDGQEAMPGDPVPQPLEVSVTDGAGRPIGGATIRFTADDSDGLLARSLAGLAGSTVSEVDATTAADGLARCFWRPAADPARPSQRVTAVLVGGAVTGTPVHFAAGLSLADRVWFEPGGCTALGAATTVQEALDQLVTAWSVVAIGGDGQAGPPGSDLPLPIEVLVRSGCGPVSGAQVRFAVASGAVAETSAALAGASSVDITADPDGMARCAWRLGPDDQVQALAAELLPGTAPVAEPTRLAFTASLERGRDDAVGLHVTGVTLVAGGPALLNDSLVAAADLAGGVAVVLDGPPAAATVTGKPVLRLTLDLPYPFSESDRALWAPGDVAGTVPLTLAGDVALGTGPAITWTPTAGAVAFLDRLFNMVDEFDRGEEVLCHLTLTGRAVADDQGRVVNGLAVGRPGSGGTTELVLPSVDDVHGADFTQWFRLVPFIVNLVAIPTRGGLLRLKRVRDTLDLAVPRRELRSRVRPGVLVSGRAEADLELAEHPAGRGFNNGKGRRLVVVADERYADAAAVIRDALSRLRIEVEVIPAADPVAAVRDRTAAGEQLDAVLTDDASVLPITDLGGFGKVIPL